jgi:hypothetical protein
LKKILLPSFLIGVAYLIFNKSKTNVTEMVQSLNILPKGIDFNLKDPFNPKIVLQISVNNPTNTSAIINKIYATIKNNGENFATINNNDNVTIKGNSENILSINLNVDVSNILQNLGNISPTFEVQGYAITGVVKIPFNKSLTIKLPF